MSRTLTTAFIAELNAIGKCVVFFFEGTFTDGTVYLWSGIGDVTWNGHTWNGAGSLGSISQIEDTTSLSASGVRVTLSGVPSAAIQDAVDNMVTNQPCKLWFGFVNAAGTIVADPCLMFSGLLDVPEISDDGQTCTISITYENRLRDLERPREWRYTHEHQQILYPGMGDRGFEYVAALQNWDGRWGQEGNSAWWR